QSNNEQANAEHGRGENPLPPQTPADLAAADQFAIGKVKGVVNAAEGAHGEHVAIAARFTKPVSPRVAHRADANTARAAKLWRQLPQRVFAQQPSTIPKPNRYGPL